MKPRKRQPPKPARQARLPARGKASRRKTTPRASTSRGKDAKPPLAAKPAVLPLVIPSLLLEGDTAPPLVKGGPGERFAVGPVPPAPELPAGAPAGAVPAPPALALLPAAYGTGRLWLVAQEPRCLCAQWDLTDAQLAIGESRAAAGRLTLKVSPAEAPAEPHRRIELPPGARACFVTVERGGATWVAEIGYWDKSGQWQSVATSEPATAPPETLQTAAVPQFAALVIGAPAPALAPEGPPVAGQPAGTAATALTPLQPALPAALPVAQEPVAPSVPPTPVAPETPPAGPAQPKPLPAAPGWPLGIPVGVTSPAGAPGSPGRPAAPRGFWLNLGVELVIYGATEPDAKLTIGDRLIKLRPDGTFSVRLALPDGQYELPLVAISAKDDDGRSAMLEFSRHTDYWGAANLPDSP